MLHFPPSFTPRLSNPKFTASLIWTINRKLFRFEPFKWNHKHKDVLLLVYGSVIQTRQTCPFVNFSSYKIFSQWPLPLYVSLRVEGITQRREKVASLLLKPASAKKLQHVKPHYRNAQTDHNTVCILSEILHKDKLSTKAQKLNIYLSLNSSGEVKSPSKNK